MRDGILAFAGILAVSARHNPSLEEKIPGYVELSGEVEEIS